MLENIVRHTEDFVIFRFIKSRFHCKGVQTGKFIKAKGFKRHSDLTLNQCLSVINRYQMPQRNGMEKK